LKITLSDKQVSMVPELKAEAPVSSELEEAVEPKQKRTVSSMGTLAPVVALPARSRAACAVCSCLWTLRTLLLRARLQVVSRVPVRLVCSHWYC